MRTLCQAVRATWVYGEIGWQRQSGCGRMTLTGEPLVCLVLQGACSKWDRSATEAHVNSFPNFKATVDDEIATFEIHFAALFSSRADAVPVILLHGWPGSFFEFLPLLQLMKQKYSPETLPYHLVVPSLPGFTLSEMPLLDQDISQVDVARILNRLMINIGFGSGYVSQGGDIGSRIARILAVNHEEAKGKDVQNPQS